MFMNEIIYNLHFAFAQPNFVWDKNLFDDLNHALYKFVWQINIKKRRGQILFHSSDRVWFVHHRKNSDLHKIEPAPYVS